MNRRYMGNALACLAILTAGPLQATDGYMMHGYGTRSKAMAGAGVALARDAMDGASNPATMVLVGPRFDFGASLFFPKRGFWANNDAQPSTPQIAAGHYESDNDFFLIPHFGWNHMLNDDSSIGVSVAGNGLNTSYDAALFQYFEIPDGPAQYQASSPTGVDLYQMLVYISYARRISDKVSVGVAPVLAVQAFGAHGLEPLRMMSIHPDGVTNNGLDYSYGYGVKLGLHFQASERFSLGAGIQSRIYMTPFSQYDGLLAEEGDFDIPPILQVGMAARLTSSVTAALDYEQIRYSEVAAVGNPNNLPLTPGKLGGDDGIGGGWNNANVVKLGVEWAYSPLLILRAGYSHSSQVIPKTQALLNILAPAVGREHFTAGFSQVLAEQRELSLALMYAPKETVTGLNPNTGGQTGDLEMEQFEIELGYAIRF